MFGLRVMTSILLAVVALGAVTVARSAAGDSSLRADLEKIAQRRIFFGHQSVGVNLLDGIRRLATAAGVPVRIAETGNASSVEAGTIGHAFIDENEKPLKKLKSFAQVMGQSRTAPDIALMKFCFVDFTADTDVKALFASYRATIESLRAQHPGTTFVHVTAPLTTVEGGLTARMKYLMGSAPLYGTLENMRREEYNTLLRQAYQGREPLFDLARVESSHADGTAEAVKWQGRAVPVMIQEYSDDGGHLNDIGKDRAARELITVLAGIPGRVETK